MYNRQKQQQKQKKKHRWFKIKEEADYIKKMTCIRLFGTCNIHWS